MGLTSSAIFPHSAVELRRSLPSISAAAGDDVYHAAEGFGAVQRGHRAAHDLDALDSFDRHPAQIEIRVRHGAACVADALSIDQYQGVLASHSTDAHAPARHANAGELQPGSTAQRILEILNRSQCQLLPTDHRHAGRRIAKLPEGRRGGHDGWFQMQRLVGEGRQWKEGEGGDQASAVAGIAQAVTAGHRVVFLEGSGGRAQRCRPLKRAGRIAVTREIYFFVAKPAKRLLKPAMRPSVVVLRCLPV